MMSSKMRDKNILLGGKGRIVRYLMQHMRGGKAGMILPSFRTLSEKCRVSPVTTTEVIRIFEEQGLLTIKPRSGIFIPDTLPENWSQTTGIKEISVFYIGVDPTAHSTNSFRQELITSLSVEPGRRDTSVRFHDIAEGYEGIRQINKFIAKNRCDACLIIHMTSTDILEPLRDAHIPFVCLYPESPRLPANNSLLVDVERITELQLEYLLALGHRRIGYLHNVDPLSYQRGFQLRREAFYRIALDHNLPITSALVKYAGMDREEEKQGALALLQQENPPTAIICNDAHLPALYNVAASLGLTIGKDLCIMGTNDGPEAQTVDPPATTLRIPRQTAVITALDLLNEVLCSPTATAPNQFVDVNIIKRQSTCDISNKDTP